MHEWSAIAFEFIFIMIRSLCHISHSNFSFSNIGFTSLHLGHSHSFNVIEGKVIFLTKKKNGFCWTRAASRTPFFFAFIAKGEYWRKSSGCWVKEKVKFERKQQRHREKNGISCSAAKGWTETETDMQPNKSMEWDSFFCTQHTREKMSPHT